MNKEITDFAWYQTIEFEPGVTSHGCPWCGDPAWENIKLLLPPALYGMRILDLGCNAGIFCIRAIQMGADECVGIESNDWKPQENYQDQALFVRDYFEHKEDKLFPVTYRWGRMEEVLKEDLGHFDYALAIASLYYAIDQESVVRRLRELCDNVIIRVRDESRIELLTGLFEKNGFKMKAKMREEWWKKLGIPTDDFWLFHYA